MKKIIIALLALNLMFTTYAQNNNQSEEINTILGNNSYTQGGYGAFGAGYSMIDDMDAFVVSGRAAWIVGHSLAIGVAGSGFINDIHYNPVLDDDVNLNGGYGGILVEPIIFPKAPVHLAFPITAGAGGIAYTRISYNGDPWEYGTAFVEDTEAFLFFEPGVEMELNVLKFFRLALGMSYRMTTNIELYDTNPDVLNGITTSLTFKFGKF